MEHERSGRLGWAPAYALVAAKKAPTKRLGLFSLLLPYGLALQYFTMRKC
jgi:hypothetical protein